MDATPLALTGSPLWRDEITLQIGLAGRVRFTAPAPWQLEIITALDRGTTRSELGHLAERLGAGEHLDALLHELSVVIAQPATLLRVSLHTQGADAARDAAHLLGALTPISDISLAPSDGADVAWIVGRSVLVPRTCVEFMANDSPHLPIIIGRSSIRVGPVIVPGLTACGACLALHEAHVDPVWPVLAAQLVGRRSRAVSPDAWGEVIRTARRLSLGTPEEGGVSVAVDLTERHPPREHRFRPSEDCGCQFLAETERERAETDPRPVPTIATG